MQDLKLKPKTYKSEMPCISSGLEIDLKKVHYLIDTGSEICKGSLEPDPMYIFIGVVRSEPKRYAGYETTPFQLHQYHSLKDLIIQLRSAGANQIFRRIDEVIPCKVKDEFNMDVLRRECPVLYQNM